MLNFTIFINRIFLIMCKMTPLPFLTITLTIQVKVVHNSSTLQPSCFIFSSLHSILETYLHLVTMGNTDISLGSFTCYLKINASAKNWDTKEDNSKDECIVCTAACQKAVHKLRQHLAVKKIKPVALSIISDYCLKTKLIQQLIRPT